MEPSLGKTKLKLSKNRQIKLYLKDKKFLKTPRTIQGRERSQNLKMMFLKTKWRVLFNFYPWAIGAHPFPSNRSWARKNAFRGPSRTKTELPKVHMYSLLGSMIITLRKTSKAEFPT